VTPPHIGELSLWPMTRDQLRLAQEAIALCQELATFSETPSGTTRTFLSAPMHACHGLLGQKMSKLGMHVRVDAIGNLRGVLPGANPNAGRLLIGSHIDTVPNAGAYDGVLGVAIALVLIESLLDRQLGLTLEVIAFSEEEGVRFGVPFLGSRAVTGDLGPEDLVLKDKNGVTVADAIRDFGLDPHQIEAARMRDDVVGFLEFHIEQGPVLDTANEAVGIVEAIAGQSRFEASFFGVANHAGTTPMTHRRDALAGAAEWVSTVEREALSTNVLVATVGRLEVYPGAGNVIPGQVIASLDVRSADDSVRALAVGRMLSHAREIAQRKQLKFEAEQKLDQPAVPMNAHLVSLAVEAFRKHAIEPRLLVSGAGHDAMILARLAPAAMIFLRSPGGISHHPDEAIRVEDVATAIPIGRQLIEDLDAHYKNARFD
jgi:allantoate deiminase